MLMATEFKPITYIVLNFIIGYLVASGHLDPAQKDQAMQLGESLVGGIIIIATAGAGIYRIVKHPHPGQTTTTMTVKQDRSPAGGIDSEQKNIPLSL